MGYICWRLVGWQGAITGKPAPTGCVAYAGSLLQGSEFSHDETRYHPLAPKPHRSNINERKKSPLPLKLKDPTTDTVPIGSIIQAQQIGQAAGKIPHG